MKISIFLTNRYFQLEGPLNLSRSVQGRPVLYTAAMSQTFISHATSYTDGVLTHGSTLEGTVAIANELRRQLAKKGRKPEDFIVSVSQNPIVGRTEQEAQEKYMELLRLIPNNSLAPPQFLVPQRNCRSGAAMVRSGTMDMLILRQDHPCGLRDFINLVAPILQER